MGRRVQTPLTRQSYTPLPERGTGPLPAVVYVQYWRLLLPTVLVAPFDVYPGCYDSRIG